jgi:hypothetical protein
VAEIGSSRLFRTSARIAHCRWGGALGLQCEKIVDPRCGVRSQSARSFANPSTPTRQILLVRRMASVVRLRLLSQIRQLAQAAIYGSLSETYPAWKSSLPLPPWRSQAWSPLIYQLPRKNRKNYRLLCSPGCRSSDPLGSRRLVSTPGSFARTGGLE